MLRVRRTQYVEDWEKNRQTEIKELTSKGIIPNKHELEKHPEKSVRGLVPPGQRRRGHQRYLACTDYRR